MGGVARSRAALRRDPVAAVIAFNRRFVGPGRDAAALALKLERLAATPFGFLRGTFHLFAADFQASALAPLLLPAQAVLGDAHLENLGAYRAAHGEVVFDVNDFDEAGRASPVFDLARFATSIVLARPDAADHRAVARIEAFLESWRRALADAGDPRWPPVVRELISEAAEVRRGRWLDKRVETTRAGQRRFKQSSKADAKYERVREPALRASIAAGVAEFGRTYSARPSPAWPDVLDIALRRAGLGSLGRKRWVALIAGDRPRGKERVLELKESLPALLGPKRAASARRVVALQRRLQGAAPLFLGATHIGGVPYTVRELQPTEARLDTGDPALDLESVCAACGAVFGHLHRRGGAREHQVRAYSERSLVRSVAPFALRYAETVIADHARFCAELERVRAALAPGRAARR
jgi:uncharacterized protein (DUF2252 family)